MATISNSIYQNPIIEFPSEQDHLLPNQQEKRVETLAQKVFPGNLRRELPHNIMRDIAWTGVAAANIGPAGKALPALNPTASLSSQLGSYSFALPTAAQLIFGTVPMMVLAAADTYRTKKQGHKLSPETVAKIWAPAIAASAAIPMWNLGQTIGAQIGTAAYGVSIAAGLIAAPFAGVFEGFTQWSIKYLADVATNPVLRQMWRQDSTLMSKLLVKELLLNITIGAIPGAIWQMTYFLVLPALILACGPVGGIILTAFIVGFAVFSSNLVCAHAINKASKEIDKRLGWDEEFKASMARAEQALAERERSEDNPFATEDLEPSFKTALSREEKTA